MQSGLFRRLFSPCGKAIHFFPLFEQYKEATYLLQFLDLVHGGCQYCLESSKGMWESQIPRLVPSFSAPSMTFRNAMALLMLSLSAWEIVPLFLYLREKWVLKSVEERVAVAKTGNAASQFDRRGCMPNSIIRLSLWLSFRFHVHRTGLTMDLTWELWKFNPNKIGFLYLRTDFFSMSSFN